MKEKRPYVIAVKMGKSAEFFEFPTSKQRTSFIRAASRRFGRNFEYATTTKQLLTGRKRGKK